MLRSKRIATALLLTLVLSMTAAFATRGAAQAAQPGGGCNANNVHGICFDTLPRLYCCSPAFLGWSGIYVGDRFPVSGKIGGGTRSDSLTIGYPSGRTASLPVTEGAAFRGAVSFDEEGQYTLQWMGPQGDVMKDVFYVAYQVRAADQTPALSDLFGADHGAFGNLVLAVKQSQHSVRLQFTDGAGKPARNQTLSTKYADSLITSDGDGMADLPLNLEQGPLPAYPLARPYPGLVVESYREVTAGGDGTLAGLPGGSVTGQQLDGVWYYGLREFFSRADPWTFPANVETFGWDGDTRTVSFAGLRLMADTGEVLGARRAMRLRLANVAGRLYVPLPDLARLFDQIGYAHLTENGTLRIGNAFIP